MESFTYYNYLVPKQWEEVENGDRYVISKIAVWPCCERGE